MNTIQLYLLLSLVYATSTTIFPNHPTTNAQVKIEEIQKEFDLKAAQLVALRTSKRDLEYQSKKENIIAMASGVTGIVATFPALFAGMLLSWRRPQSSWFYLCYTPLAAGTLATYSFARKSRKHPKEANYIGYQMAHIKTSLETLKDQLEEVQASSARI